MIRPYSAAPRPRLVCVDPGSTASGVVVLDLDIPSGPVVWAAKVENVHLVRDLRNGELSPELPLNGHLLVVEMMQARGMPFSNDEMRTLVWLGRFIEAWGGEWREVFRKDVKMHLCGQVKANDSNIRAALIDRFGGEPVALARQTKCPTCKGAGRFGQGRGSKRTTHDCHVCGMTGKVGTTGPLHSISTDCWSALALGLTYSETAPLGAREVES